MMLDALVLGLDARTKVARLSHTTISEDELFELLISELGLEHHGGGKLERLGEIQRFLDEWTAAGRNSVLVVDEAQNLALPVLEEIRLLSNLRSQGQCSLQIVLAGQPEFRTRLDQDNLRQLKQRIGIRYHLTPLSAGETGEYISHRLNVAGAEGSTIFDRGAIDAIFAYAGGVPRMINVVCDRALVAGYGANRRRIGKALILETVEDIEGAVLGVPPAAASDGAVPTRPAEAADAPPARPSPSSEPAPIRAVHVTPDSASVSVAASDPVRPRERTSARAFPTRAGGVVGASIRNRVVPAWVLPSLLVVAALAAAIFSAVSTGWWRTLVEPRDGGPTVTSVAGRKDPVDVGESVDAGGEDFTTENSDISGESVGLVAVSDIVETSVEEAGASEGDGATAVAVPEIPGEIGEIVEEAATQYTATPTPSADEPELASSWQDIPGISGPGGSYRAVALSGRDADSASKEVSLLAERGFSAEVIPVDIGDGGLWYRVAVRGGYPALDEAREIVDELKRLGYDSAWVLRE